MVTIPKTMKITSITMWTHHTQLKETTKCNNRCVIATASGPVKLKLVGLYNYGCPVLSFLYSHGKGPKSP